MKTKNEALQQALAVLKWCLDHPDAQDAIDGIEEALAQQDLVTKEVSLPEQEYLDVVAVTLMREGVDKHRAREYAQHFFTMAQLVKPAQPEQEPYCYVYTQYGQEVFTPYSGGVPPHKTAIPLYTSPLKRTPLASEQVKDWWAGENGLEDCCMSKLDDFMRVVRVIEAAHDIKEQQGFLLQKNIA